MMTSTTPTVRDLYEVCVDVTDSSMLDQIRHRVLAGYRIDPIVGNRVGGREMIVLQTYARRCFYERFCYSVPSYGKGESRSNFMMQHGDASHSILIDNPLAGPDPANMVSGTHAAAPHSHVGSRRGGVRPRPAGVPRRCSSRTATC